LLNDLVRDSTPLWDGLLHDSFTFHAAFDYLREEHPRVLYIAFDETDDWAHEGRYDRYLQAAHRVDEFVGRLWNFIQSNPRYRNRTTLILTADHGRGTGEGPKGWRDHGKDVPGAEDIWLAVVGPDTPALGERSQTPLIYQNQIAATLAAFLGEDFAAALPRAGKPIRELAPP
jgi:bisphosphoglycerate-independent phosphoglycerate mutase (AlkP superfamily)